MIRSQIWSGSVTCWKQSRQLQIYVGDGLKRERIEPSEKANTDREVDNVKTYYPVEIPFVPEDPTDFLGQPEPNGLDYDSSEDWHDSMDHDEHMRWVRHCERKREREEKAKQALNNSK